MLSKVFEVKAKVDLHTHSSASDGTLSPEALVELAKEKNITFLSITDHDTVAGVTRALARGKELGVVVVPGIEVTADASFLGPGRREFHILGYYMNLSSSSLKELVEFSHTSRVRRNVELLARLNELGYPVIYDEMVKRYGDNFGKPNIAKVLMDMGYFTDREKAIDFLSSLSVERQRLDYKEVLSLLREAGAIAVIAHPVTLGISYTQLYCLVKEAIPCGLSGLEVYHHKHTAKDIVAFKSIVRELKLYSSGGSDFHGANKPRAQLGFPSITTEDINFPLYQPVL